jgi:hypothetical protein
MASAAGEWVCWLTTRQGERWPLPLPPAEGGETFEERRSLDATSLEEDWLVSFPDPGWAERLATALRELDALSKRSAAAELGVRCAVLAEMRPDPQGGRAAAAAHAHVYLDTGLSPPGARLLPAGGSRNAVAVSRPDDSTSDAIDRIASLCRWPSSAP